MSRVDEENFRVAEPRWLIKI